MSRLPTLGPDNLDAAQAEIYHRIASGARGGVRGPHTVLLHSPKLAGLVEQLGLYVRYQCAVPERLRELAILIVAAHWKADYEWYAHAGLARRQGLSDEVVAGIGRGERPEFEGEDEAVVFDYCRELLAHGRVANSTYGKTRALLSERDLVDLTALVGYYSLLALTLNAFEVATPGDVTIPWREP